MYCQILVGNSPKGVICLLSVLDFVFKLADVIVLDCVFTAGNISTVK